MNSCYLYRFLLFSLSTQFEQLFFFYYSSHLDDASETLKTHMNWWKCSIWHFNSCQWIEKRRKNTHTKCDFCGGLARNYQIKYVPCYREDSKFKQSNLLSEQFQYKPQWTKHTKCETMAISTTIGIGHIEIKTVSHTRTSTKESWRTRRAETFDYYL